MIAATHEEQFEKLFAEREEQEKREAFAKRLGETLDEMQAACGRKRVEFFRRVFGER